MCWQYLEGISIRVKELKRQKVDYVEVDTTLTPELYIAVADEAKRQHLSLVGHIPANISARDIAAAGQVDVEHLGGRFLNVLIACSSDEPRRPPVMVWYAPTWALLAH